jgi:uncharacterized repeat protein (TIGR03843 family)
VSAEERQEPGLLTREERSVRLLQAGQLEVIGRLPYSSNQTFLARCCEGDDELMAVYKPAAGELPLYDFPGGTLYRREVAAYLVDRALGWGLVPPTVGRGDAPLGPGSVQLFIDHDPELHYFTLLDSRERRFMRMATFDIICNNADRKSGHCLLSADGAIHAVDHGLTFHAEPKLRTVIWDFAGKPVPRVERAAAGRLAARLADQADPLTIALAALLEAAEVDALQQRAASMQQPGVFPHPGSSWSFPWPLV